VVGAGPAGCATALSLARRGVADTVLIDGDRDGRAAVGETIPPDTRLPLAELGVFDAFLAQGHRPCLGSCSSWGSEALGHNDFLLNPHGTGWHLDRPRFDTLLRQAARRAGVTVRSGARCAGIRPLPGGGFRLALPQAAIDARFVVDATGASAAVARRLGARPATVDKLLFVYGFLDAPALASRLTLLEAVPDGWWYSAGLPGGRLAVAVAADPDHARRHDLARPAGWLRAALATRHLAPRLAGRAPAAPDLLVRSCATFRLDPVTGPGWLAVGDAAATYDPLMSQGIHKALTDGIRAAAALTDAAPYAQPARTAFDEYLATREYLYALEKRWPDSPFWRRRQREPRELTAPCGPRGPAWCSPPDVHR
jgi:flavin-dependent dehydrogenase